MTVSNEVSSKEYTTQGLADETFPTTFSFDKAADLFVYLDGAQQTLGTNYSVTGGNGAIGSVVWSGTPTANKTLLIIGRGPATQTKDYLENDAFPAEDHEKTVDRLARMGQAALRRDSTDARTFDAGGDRISDLGTPTGAGDAATKAYVDAAGAPTVTIPDPGGGDDDKHIQAVSSAYVLAFPPFKKADLPVGGDTGKVLTATGAATFNWQTPVSAATIVPRNFLINGDFQISQRRGEGGTHNVDTPHSNADTNYVLDRWKILSEVAADGVDVTHEQTIVPQGATGAIKLEVETAGAPNNKFGIIQYLSSETTKQLLKDGTSSKVTLSFKARTTTGAIISNIRIAVLAWTGTVDDLPSDPVTAWNAAGSNPTLDGGFTFENTPANLAVGVDSYGSQSELNVAMDTVGTNNIAIFIWVDDVSNAVSDVLYLGDIQLEIGVLATQFVRRDVTSELLLCQRYAVVFRAAAAGEVLAVGFAKLTTIADLVLHLPVRMRADATSLVFANLRIAHENTTAALISLPLNASRDTVGMSAEVAAVLTVGAGAILEMTNSSGLLSFDVEL